MLSLQQLKSETYLQWETLLLERGAFNPYPLSFDVSTTEANQLPFINLAFKAEIRQQFGDLRCRSTWETAAIALTAHGMAQSFLEPYQVIGFMVSPEYMESPIRRHYGERLVAEMMTYPEVIDRIRRGLEQIYRDGYSEERALVDQFIAAGHQLPGIHALPAVAA